MAERGLAVMKRPGAAAGATLFQTIGWTLQLFAVYTVMRAFGFGTVPAAALVLVLMNVATVFPFWPGNVGLLQAAIALPLSTQYGIAYGKGFAYGLALQAVEMSAGVGLGTVYLAREGLSFANLRGMDGEMDEPSDELSDEPESQPETKDAREDERARARLPG